MQWVRSLCVVALAAFCASPAFAGTHTEDFGTDPYKDATNTTAFWDTSDENLRLHDFPLTVVGTAVTGTAARGVAVAGNYAFVAENGGLRSVRILDPTTPATLGWAAYSGQAFDVVVDGNYAFVAAEEALWVADVSVPASPVLAAASLHIGSTGFGVAVDGQYVYEACGTAGLRVYQFSPSGPVLNLIGSVATDDARAIVVSGDYAFIADGSAGLTVVDITAPVSPSIAANVPVTAGNCESIHIAGDYAYLGDYDGDQLAVFAITDPETPSLAATAPLADVRGIELAGDFLYAACTDVSGGVGACSVETPTAPAPMAAHAAFAEAYDLVVAGEHAFVAAGSGGLEVVRIAEAISPSLMANVHGPRSYDIVVEGNYAYVADLSRALFVYDVSDPTNIGSAHALNVSGTGYSVVLHGDYAYVGLSSQIYVVDISTPTNPTYLAAVSHGAISGYIYGLAIQGNRLYAAATSSRHLVVFDISHPVSPTYISYVSLPDSPYDIDIAGRYAYIADYVGGGLMMYDITTTPPTFVNRRTFGSPAYAVDIAGDVAYVANYNTIYAVDISSPSMPILGTSPPGPPSIDITVDGDFAYVVDQGGRFRRIDISDPTAMVDGPIVSLSFPGWGVAVAGDFAFITGSTLFRPAQVFNRHIVTADKVGQSLDLNPTAFDVLKARLTTTHTGNVTWSISADDGANWQAITPDGAWNDVTNVGSDLLWKSLHTYDTYALNPTADALELEYLYAESPIDALVDVPNDQGGWLRLHFTRSAFDFTGDPTPITGYQILREVPAALAARVLEQGVAPVTTAERSAMPARTTRILDDRSFVVSSLVPEGTLPAGTWEVLGFVAAYQQHEYTVLVPTLGDETEGGTTWTRYLITTHTSDPTVWYAGLPDSGFSIDNIAPAAPTGLALAEPMLQWDAATELDFNYYTIFGGPTADIGDASVIGYATEPLMDVTGEHHPWYFVTTKDVAGNESPPANVVAPVGVSEPIHLVTGLSAIAPNPFAAVTEIRFALATAGAVRMDVFDVSGRLVHTLFNGGLEAGEHHLAWHRETDTGAIASAGIYFVRMIANGKTAHRRIVAMD